MVTKFKFSADEVYTLEELMTPKMQKKLMGRTYTLVEE